MTDDTRVTVARNTLHRFTPDYRRPKSCHFCGAPRNWPCHTNRRTPRVQWRRIFANSYKLWLLIFSVASACFIAGGSTAEARTPRLPLAEAQEQVTSYQVNFAMWRIRLATHVSHPVYPDLYDPAEAAHWRMATPTPNCHRESRSVVACQATVTVWDSRTGEGEFASWWMATRRHRDERVRGGLVTLTRLLCPTTWEEVTVSGLA